MTNDIYPGSTMTPTGVVTPKLQSDSISTNTVELNGDSVKGISHDYTTADREKIASAFALKLGLASINSDISDLLIAFNKIFFSPVLSDPIADPYFIDAKWTTDGFTFEDSTAIFIEKNTNIQGTQGYVRLTSQAFNMTGTHFVYITILSLGSNASVKLVDYHGTILKNITIPGTYSLEITIDQPTIYYLDLSVSGLAKNESCVIGCCFVHYVKTAFSRYMEYMADHLLSGGSGFASTTYVDSHVNSALSASYTYVDAATNNITNELILHIADRNPHGTTYTDVGAAPTIHAHTPEQCGAAAKIHTHLPTECGAAATIHDHTVQDLTNLNVITDRISTLESSVGNSTIGSDLTAHKIDYNNPHQVTALQTGAANKIHTHIPTECGAAAIVHTHFPSECGAAPLVHSHTVSNITDIDTITDRITTLETANSTDQTSTTLNSHIANLANPHSVTKEQVSLGQVINAGMATDQEAISGNARDKYINPANIHAVIADLLGQGSIQTTKLIPTPIAVIDFNSMGLSVDIPIQLERQYKISIQCRDSSLKSLGIKIDGVTNSIRSCIVTPSNLVIGGSTYSVMTSTQIVGDHYSLMPSTVGINQANGELTFDTNSFTLTGILHGHVADENGNEIVSSGFPIEVSGGYVLGMEPTTVSTMTFYSTDNTTMDMKIVVYELLQTTQEPVLVVDATPVGMITYRYGQMNAVGWGLLDGSELSRTVYPELYQYAVDAGNIIFDVDWQSAVTTDGKCDKFSYGNEVDTFRLPKDILSPTAENRYIKLKYTQVPSGDEILYRFVWLN